MGWRRFLRYMALSVTLLPVAGRPNIVFLLTDDQEASFIGVSRGAQHTRLRQR